MGPARNGGVPKNLPDVRPYLRLHPPLGAKSRGWEREGRAEVGGVPRSARRLRRPFRGLLTAGERATVGCHRHRRVTSIFDARARESMAAFDRSNRNRQAPVTSCTQEHVTDRKSTLRYSTPPRTPLCRVIFSCSRRACMPASSDFCQLAPPRSQRQLPFG